MDKYLKYLLILILVNSLVNQNGYSQKDTLNHQQLKMLLSGQAIGYGLTMLGLNELWYKDYPRSGFHFFNDSKEWMQMDKMGHVFSAYTISGITTCGFEQVGMDKKKSALYGAGLAWFYMASIEIFDGFSKKWGASVTDLVANTFGTGVYLAQEFAYNQQRLRFKYSFHPTKYAKYRPDLLGEGFETISKDYNGATYWISANISSFATSFAFPKWINLAVGYSADGMLGAKNNDLFLNGPIVPDFERKRQYYLSLDIDLTRIHTKSGFLKYVFKAVNVIKIPFPAIEFTNDGFKGYWMYF